MPVVPAATNNTRSSGTLHYGDYVIITGSSYVRVEPKEISGAMSPHQTNRSTLVKTRESTQWLYSPYGHDRYCQRYLPSAHYKPKKRAAKATHRVDDSQAAYCLLRCALRRRYQQNPVWALGG